MRNQLNFIAWQLLRFFPPVRSTQGEKNKKKAYGAAAASYENISRDMRAGAAHDRASCS